MKFKTTLALSLALCLAVGSVAWQCLPLAQATNAQESVYQLTGLPAEDTSWRPVAVSVNSEATRILGIGSTSVVYEVLAQGSETSMALLYNNIWEMPTVGPVDQATDIIWQFALPQNTIFIQNGWNLYAENLLNCYAYQPIDAQIEGTTAFVYDNGGDTSLSNEYCWFISNVEAYAVLESYGVSAVGESTSLFSFGENTTATSAASSLWVQYAAGAGSFFSYDSASNQWLMSNTEGQRVDAATGENVAFDNVFLLSATSGVKDDGYTRSYDLTEGTGLYLTNGAWQKITWYKGDVTDALVVLDENGNQLTVNSGTSYIGIYGGFTGQMITLTTPTESYDASILS